MNKNILLIAFMAISFIGFSQETTTLEKKPFKSTVPTTDRGAYTRTGENIKKGLQLELGLDYEWIDSKNTVFKTDVFSPIEMKLRLGLAKYVEVDFAISNRQMVLRPWDEDGTFKQDKYGYWSPMQIGVRAQFIDSKLKGDANASLYLGLGVNNTQRSAFNDDGSVRPWVLVDRPSYVTPEMALFIDHTIANRLELGYNFGVRWTGQVLDDAASAKNPDVFYTVRALLHLAKPWDLYVEHFNFMRKSGPPTLGINVGTRLAATKKLVIDINGGLGLNENSPEGFAGLGLSYKLGK